MIDMRTRFFAGATVVSFFFILVAPDDLKFVPFWVGVIYILLTLLCGLDSISRNHSNK